MACVLSPSPEYDVVVGVVRRAPVLSSGLYCALKVANITTCTGW